MGFFSKPAVFENDRTASFPTRAQWIEVNQEFVRLWMDRSDLSEIVNVGAAPGDGTGDTSAVALSKVIHNLRRIRYGWFTEPVAKSGVVDPPFDGIPR